MWICRAFPRAAGAQRRQRPSPATETPPKIPGGNRAALRRRPSPAARATPHPEKLIIINIYLWDYHLFKMPSGRTFPRKIEGEGPEAAGDGDAKRRPSPLLLGKPVENGGVRPAAASLPAEPQIPAAPPPPLPAVNRCPPAGCRR